MKISRIKLALILILGALLTTGGCSSVNKARSLHQEGKTEKALAMAEELLDDGEDLKTRLGAVEVLEEIGGNRAGEILMSVLDDKAVPVKNAAIKSIGRIKYAPASGKLLSIGMTSHGETLETVAGAIRNIGSPAIDLLVKKYTASASAAEQQRYKSLMLAVGPSVASGIAKNLAGKSYFENRTNFELLIAFKSPEVATWLLKEIGNNEIADNVMEGLVKLGGRAITPVISQLNQTPANAENETIRIHLITVLGQLKAKQATDLLEKMTTDDFDRVRKAADLALVRIRGF